MQEKIKKRGKEVEISCKKLSKKGNNKKSNARKSQGKGNRRRGNLIPEKVGREEKGFPYSASGIARIESKRVRFSE